MKRSAKLLLSILTTLTISLPSIARADNTGSTGKIESVTTYHSSSSNYGKKRGELVVLEGNGTLRNYVFGGNICANTSLSDIQLEILAQTVNNEHIHITPYWKNGLAGSRCLVGFKLQSPAKLGPS